MPTNDPKTNILNNTSMNPVAVPASSATLTTNAVDLEVGPPSINLADPSSKSKATTGPEMLDLNNTKVININDLEEKFRNEVGSTDELSQKAEHLARIKKDLELDIEKEKLAIESELIKLKESELKVKDRIRKIGELKDLDKEISDEIDEIKKLEEEKKKIEERIKALEDKIKG